QSRSDDRQDHKSDEGRSNVSSRSGNERENPSGSGFHPGKEKVFGIGEVQRVDIGTLQHRSEVKGGGRRVRVRSKDKRGVYVSSCIPRSDPIDIAFDATLRAAALRNKGSGCITIEKEDIREKVRYSRAPSLVIFLVDASGSMAAMRRMEAAKGAAISILNDAYLYRDQIAFIAFRGDSAEVLLPPTRNLEQAVDLLAELPTGGRTPLAAALLQSAELIKLQKIRRRDIKPVVVLISDGKANVPLRAEGDIREELIELSGWLKRLGANVVILDTSPNNALTFAPNYLTDIAYASGGQYIRLEDVSESSIYGVLRQVL
ncbi:MAG TPA: VWA domain-containing protein, partial [Candidatus Korarchaeota archaeon]|nr:VWA domain-containing protein [Candidatus Korarchaeota archaeon]